MGDHRLSQRGVGGGGGHLHEGVHPLGHIGDGDGAVRLGLLCADDLTVTHNVKNSTGEGIAAVVQLDEPDLYLGVVLENQGHVSFAVPYKGLLGLIHIGAFGVALRGSDLLGGVTAQGHILPGHVRQVTARAGDVGPGEVVVHALDFNDRPSEAPGGIVRVHLADTALAGDLRSIAKRNSYNFVGSIGQNDILGTRVVDLITLRGFQFRHGVGARFQLGYGNSAVAACHHFLGVGTIFGGYLEPRPRQALVGIRAVYLFDDQVIQLTGHGQFTDHDGLHIICRMVAGAGTGICVFINGALAPYALRAQVEDILRPVPERSAVHSLVNTGIIGVFQIVVDAQQFLSAGNHGVGQQTGLVAPDDGLGPGVHRPCVVAVPHIIYTQSLGLISKDAGGVGVEVRHHGFDGGVVDRLGTPPGVALQ